MFLRMYEFSTDLVCPLIIRKMLDRVILGLSVPAMVFPMNSENRFDATFRPSRPVPVDCIVGETIRRVRVLTEAEWEAIPRISVRRRPSTSPDWGGVVAGADAIIKRKRRPGCFL